MAKSLSDTISSAPRREVAQGFCKAHPQTFGRSMNLNDYKIIDRPGNEGTWEVLTARKHEDDTVVTLRRLNTTNCKESELSRLVRALKSWQRLKDDKIIRVLEWQKLDHELVVATEFVNGTPLRELPNDLTVILSIMSQVAQALAVAHRAGILHRNLKPDCIYLTRDNEVKVGGWGMAVAKEDDSGLTRTGVILGTPDYIAPEKITENKWTKSSDLYSFGTTLFELLARRLPYGGHSVIEKLKARLEKKAPLLSTIVEDVPPALDELLSSLLDKNPKERPKSTEEVAKKLRSMALGSFDKERTLAVNQKSQRRSPLLPIMALLAIVCVFIYSQYGSEKPKAAPTKTRERKTLEGSKPTEMEIEKAKSKYLEKLSLFWQNPRTRVSSSALRNPSKLIPPFWVRQQILQKLDELRLSEFNHTKSSKELRSSGVLFVGASDLLLRLPPLSPSDKNYLEISQAWILARYVARYGMVCCRVAGLDRAAPLFDDYGDDIVRSAVALFTLPPKEFRLFSKDMRELWKREERRTKVPERHPWMTVLQVTSLHYEATPQQRIQIQNDLKREIERMKRGNFGSSRKGPQWQALFRLIAVICAHIHAPMADDKAFNSSFYGMIDESIAQLPDWRKENTPSLETKFILWTERIGVLRRWLHVELPLNAISPSRSNFAIGKAQETTLAWCRRFADKRFAREVHKPVYDFLHNRPVQQKEIVKEFGHLLGR